VSTDRDRPVNDGSGAEPEPAEEGTVSDGASDAVFRTEVRQALAGMSARLDREHERAAHREAVIDRLHEENQRLRGGELQAMLEPVRAALYRLHDQARRESGRLAAPEGGAPPNPGQTALLLAAVADDVADALARLGVDRFTVEPGAPYDPARHRPVAVTAVTDPTRDGTVVTVQSDGFEQGGKVLRKAAVCVGKLDTAHRNGTGLSMAGLSTTELDKTGLDDTGLDKARSSRHRAAGRGETMNTGLGTDR